MLCDFGVSGEDYDDDGEYSLEDDDGRSTKGQVTNDRWLAKELLEIKQSRAQKGPSASGGDNHRRQNMYSKPGDIYSFGCVVLEVRRCSYLLLCVSNDFAQGAVLEGPLLLRTGRRSRGGDIEWQPTSQEGGPSNRKSGPGLGLDAQMLGTRKRSALCQRPRGCLEGAAMTLRSTACSCNLFLLCHKLE